MNKLIRFTTFVALVMLGGCAGLLREAPSIGDPEDIVQKKMGAPTSIYGAGDTRGPAGEDTYLGEADDFHPNDAGHRAIADTLLAAVTVE